LDFTFNHSHFPLTFSFFLLFVSFFFLRAGVSTIVSAFLLAYLLLLAPLLLLVSPLFVGHDIAKVLSVERLLLYIESSLVLRISALLLTNLPLLAAAGAKL
jgi:hypothetical protein